MKKGLCMAYGQADQSVPIRDEIQDPRFLRFFELYALSLVSVSFLMQSLFRVTSGCTNDAQHLLPLLDWPQA